MLHVAIHRQGISTLAPGYHHRRYPVGMLLLVALCSVYCRHRLPPKDDLTQWIHREMRFSVQARFSTYLLEDGRGEVPLEYSDPSVFNWDGTINVEPARRYRDESIGFKVDLGPIVVSYPERPNSLPVFSGLSSLSFEMRRFIGGELLQLRQLEHLSGQPRHGDLLMPLWASLGTNIPRLAVGETVTLNVHLPYILDKDRGMRLTQRVTWTREEMVQDEDGVQLHHLSYTGTVVGKGWEKRPEWTAIHSSDGECRGQVWVEVEEPHRVKHEFHWTTNLSSVFTPQGTQQPGNGSLLQHQVYDGILEDLK